jgi:hypothetical protein
MQDARFCALGVFDKFVPIPSRISKFLDEIEVFGWGLNPTIKIHGWGATWEVLERKVTLAVDSDGAQYLTLSLVTKGLPGRLHVFV